MTAATGATATLRIAGHVVSSEPGVPFWVHGTTGTLRGSVLLDSDRLELDDGDTRTPVALSGAWFVDGFAAAMGELMCAVTEGREPENSAADAALLRRPRAGRARVGRARRRSRRPRGGRRMTAPVVDEVEVDPARARVYAEGWQSWSPATWYPAGATGLRPDEDWQHTMRFRPGTPIADDALQAEGAARRRPRRRQPGPLLRRHRPGRRTDHHRDPGRRARARAVDGAGRDDRGRRRRDRPRGVRRRVRRAGRARARWRPPPTVWCSWYRYFEQVTADDVLENLRSFDDHDLLVDVVQVDDGWSPGLGEGLVVADRFGSLEAVVDEVRSTGRRAGIWVAPFLVGARSTLATEHPDWLVGPAGRNWGDDLVGLDLTHCGVLDLLAETFTRLVDLGVDYLKLDFLYARRAGSRAVAAPRT